jgi:tetratricopeptide (TPR) repeat protein
MARSAVAREFTLCASCGARNRPDWRACQRCRRDLRPAPAGPPGRSTHGPRAWVLGAAVLVPAVVAAVMMSWPEAGAPVAAASTAAPVEPAFEVPAAVATPSEPVLTPVTKEDFARAGSAAYEQGQVAVALSAFETAAAQFPDDPETRNNLGQVLVRVGRAAEAIPHLEAAVAGDGDRWTFRFNLARARGQAGDWSRAVADYQVAAQLFPDDHVTLYNLGRAQQKLGEHAAAAASLERAVALAPDEPSALLTLAFSYEKLSRIPQALQAYRDYLERDPQSRQAETIRARIGQLQQAGLTSGQVESTSSLPPGDEAPD